MHPHRFHYRIVILGFFFILSLFGIALIVQSQREGKFSQPGAATDYVKQKTQKDLRIPIKPEVSFAVVSTDSERTTIKKDERIKFFVTATSNNDPVIGYDALVGISGSGYEVVEVNSLLPEFTILKFEKPTHITITGIKKPQVKDNIVFANTRVVEIIVKATKPGSVKMQILESVGRETSKIITGPEGSSEMRKMSATGAAGVELDIK